MNIDPQEFLRQKTKGAFVTKRTPIPRGDYPAIITKVVARNVMSNGEERLIADVFFEINDAYVTEVTGIPRPTVKKGYWLDLTDTDPPQLATGQNMNVELGRLRTALGQNDEEEDWDWDMLVGQACHVSIIHDKNDYAQADKVGKSAADLGKVL